MDNDPEHCLFPNTAEMISQLSQGYAHGSAM